MKKNALTVLSRGLKKLCPACGRSPIFERRLILFSRCPKCGLELRSREPNTWFFMYSSTAFITGVFLFVMFYFKTPNPAVGQALLIALAVPSYFCTLSVRKSLAIAIDYLF